MELGSSISCGIYWMTVGMIATGICFTLNASSIMQSSPLKKALQISVPVVLNLSYYMMSYLLFLLIEALLWTVGGREQDPGVLVLYGLMAIVFMVYNSSYKIFELATVLFVVAFFSLLLGGEYLIRQMLTGLSPGLAGIIGLGEILVGALLQYCLALLTYRMPLSRRSDCLGIAEVDVDVRKALGKCRKNVGNVGKVCGRCVVDVRRCVAGVREI